MNLPKGAMTPKYLPLLIIFFLFTNQCSGPQKVAAPGLWEAIKAEAQAKQFARYVEQAGGLSLVLETAGKKTLLVPTDAAFEKLPDGIRDDLAHPDNTRLLTNVLRAHVIPGTYSEKKLSKGGLFRTAMDKDLKYQQLGENLTIEDAVVVQSLKTKEGYIHLLDKVLKN